MSDPSLSLLVLESGQIEAARDFYALLGLTFVPEKHGNGPSHYAAQLGPMVLELYPRKADTPIAPVRIGFRVSPLDVIVERVRERGVKVLRESHDSPWGRRAVVEDPDGNRVELSA